jgi:tetratricopeptide (TPR) repeat protein
MKQIYFACPLLVLVLCTIVRAQGDSRAMQDAAALYRSGKYAESAKAYEQITKADPGNGAAWSQWGNSLWEIGETRRAIEVLQTADGLLSGASQMQAGVRFRIGQAWARLDERERAFEWLDRAMQSGFPSFQLFSADPDLSKLSDDPRYWKMYARLYARTPASVSDEYRAGGKAFHGEGQRYTDFSYGQDAIVDSFKIDVPKNALGSGGLRPGFDPARKNSALLDLEKGP